MRSRRRKSTEQEQRGRDRSRGSDGQRGTTTGYGQDRHQVSTRVFMGERRDWKGSDGRSGWFISKGESDGNVSNKAVGCIASAEWHATGAVLTNNKQGFKASFYVTNFPGNLPMYRIRQAFEVCGILSDVYVARH